MMAPLWSPEVESRLRAEGRNLDRQERPAYVQQCVRCVMTNQRPRIVFDEEGVCSACRYAERKWQGGIDWDARGAQLKTLLDEHRKGAPYDVIVPCSGGKDSANVAWRLKHEHGMTPLCVTWAPFMYTDVGRRNFDAFVQSGFDVIVAYPNGLIHRKLARLALEFYGDPFIPFIYGQLSWPMNAAVRYHVPLVMFGENGEAEYGGDPAANDKPCWSDADWERVYMKGAGVDRLLEIGLRLGCITDADVAQLSPFYRLHERTKHVDFRWFGYYRRWWPQENYYLAAERTGFEPNEERSEGTYSKYASLDDKLDGLHYYFGFLKFGIGRATSDAAHEVRDSELTRDEALALVEKYDGEFPERHLDKCLDYLSMNRQHLDTVIERFRDAQVPHHRAA